MPILEEVKRLFGKVTGYGRPAARDLDALRHRRKLLVFRFADDGRTPNNPRLPLLLYRDAVRLDAGYDPAAVFEETFARHGWRDSWRDGVYPFRHFHTGTHEVLGIARGRATVELGGAAGRKLTLKAGDVVVLPAGTAHRRLAASDDLLVVGAYPPGGKYDEPRPDDVDHDKAVAAIAGVRLPKQDPVYGAGGPLRRLWKARRPKARTARRRQ